MSKTGKRTQEMASFSTIFDEKTIDRQSDEDWKRVNIEGNLLLLITFI